MIVVLGIALTLIALLLVTGFAYQWIGGLLDRKRLLAPGRLVDIGEGRRLYLLEKGSGGPSVIFESGFGATSLNWTDVQDAVAEHVHTISYDRCGLGWSSPPASERTPTRIAAELHTLLRAAGVQPPWVLVGHSFGGLVMQRFALEYPAGTAGLVLLDPMRTDEWPPLNPARRGTMERANRLTGYGVHLARFGVTRLAARSHLCRSARFSGFLIRLAGAQGEYLSERLNTEIGKMPAQVRPSIAAHWSAPRFYRGLIAHLRAVPAAVQEMHEAEPIQNVPVVVVTPGSASPIADMEKFGSLSRQVVARDSRHWVHLDEPELVVRTILEMAALARSRNLGSEAGSAVLQGVD